MTKIPGEIQDHVIEDSLAVVDESIEDDPEYAALKGKWKSVLVSTISEADCMTIKTGEFRIFEKPHILHKITDKDTITEFLALIDIDEPDAGWCCGCGGDGLLIFSKGEHVLCELTYHHARSFRWENGKWPSDVELTKSCRLPIAQWFADQGIPQFLEWNKAALKKIKN